jgi:hypothetical protein
MRAADVPPGIYAFPFKDDAQLCTGMTLRDWFAGQALAGLTTRDMPPSMGDDLDKYMHAVAAVAYGHADAMLSARDTNKEMRA